MAYLVNRGEFQFQVRYKEHGKTITAGTYNTKAEALKKIAELEEDKSVGRKVDRKKGLVTVREALKLYEDTEAKHKKSYERSRKYIYQIWQSRDHDDRLKFIDDTLSNVTIAKVKEWTNTRARHVSGSTCNRDLNELSAFFHWAKIHYEIDYFNNPVADIKRPKSNDPRDRVIQKGSDEENRLFEAFKNSGTKVLLPGMILAMEMGVRRAELCGMSFDQIHDLDTDAPYANIKASQAKTEKKRSVPLSELAVEAIKMLMNVHKELKEREARNMHQRKTDEELHNYDLLLAGLKPGSFSQAFSKAREKAGVKDIRVHDFRHICLTRLFEMNMFSITEIMSVSGHSNVNTLTKTYVNHNTANISRKLRGKQQ